MAKSPKKKPAKPAKPAPKPPAKATKAAKPVAKGKASKATKAPAKSSKPVPVMKAKKPAPAEHAKSAKPKTAVTPAPTGKTKPPKKPTKQVSVLPLMALDGDGDLPPPGGGGGVPGVAAVPKITFPLGNATVPAGMSLGVMVSTNRADLGYVVTIQDITPPGPAPAPTSFPGPNPTTNPFSVNIPAANLAAGRQYRIVVTLDAASAGNAHTDNSVTINTAP